MEPRPALEGELVVLDARDGRSIRGRIQPALDDSDADRVLVLDVQGDPRLREAVDGTRALDARFAGGGLVVLGVDHVLRFHAADGRSTELDAEVWGPLSAAGAVVAYVRGAPPDLELARADVATGEVRELTTAMAPVWSPALSPDGRAVLFVSAAGGRPQLHRLEADGAVARLAPSTRFPTAPTAPRWIGSTVVFEDGDGIAAIDAETGALVAQVGGASDLHLTPAGDIAGVVGGEARPLHELGRLP